MKPLFFLFSLIISFSCLKANASNCFEEIAIYHRTFSNGYLELSNADQFWVRDKKNPYYFFNSSLDLGDGSLYIDARLRNESSGSRSRMNGHQLYHLMMKHIGVDRIKTVQGIWSQGDNFKEFFDNVRHLGYSHEKAAFETWSGRQAAKYGFTEIAEIYVEEKPLRGSPYVYVIFSKP